MSFYENMDRRALRLGIVDTKLVQGAAFFLALVLAKLVPAVLELNVWLLAVLALACAIRPVAIFFSD